MKTILKKLLLSLLFLPLMALSQSSLSGNVLDANNNKPLPGVNVNIKGSPGGVSTDFDGSFKISGVKSGDVVVFSYIGYKTESIVFSDQKNVKIYLADEQNSLKEVVVQVGYGTVKKKDATGSVTVLSTKDFNKGSNVTTENLLSGRIAGVTINTTGAPGSGSEIRIRGGASLNASNDPLIVIDGLPIENKTNTGSTSFLASLNPNSVESITVLKDASATAIYGSRASNGVIIITTKKGTSKLAVEYNFQYGSGKLIKKTKVFSGDEFRALIALKQPTKVGQLGNANTDWQDAIYHRTDFVDNNVSIRGSLFGKIPTRLSIGNTYQEGLRLTNNFNRSTASLAMNPSFLDNHLKLKFNGNYSNERNRFAAGVEGSALSFDPTQPVYDPSSQYGGFFEFRTAGAANLTNLTPNTARNPVSELLLTREIGISDRFFGNFEIDYKFHFFPSLRFVANAGYDYSKGIRTKTRPNFAATSPSVGNDLRGIDEYTEEVFKNKVLDLYFSYNKTFGKFNVDATTGYSYQKFDKEKVESGNINLGTQNLNPNEVTTSPDIVLIGLFARANLTYNSKYLLTASYRRDASSRFRPDVRWGNFPAASFAWKMKEDFFKNSTTISDLKLRLGWGITGQQDTGDESFGYLERYIQGSPTSQYFIGGTSYPIGVAAPRTAIQWEETTTYNAGIDFGIKNNRISGSVDVFYKISEKLLSKVANADGANFTNISFQNLGSFTTKGIELNLNADVVKSEGNGFNWNVNFNATKFERRIKELDPFQRILVGDIDGGTGASIQVNQAGFTPNSFYVFKQLYDGNGNPIEGAFADLNGDNIINQSDKYVFRNTDPDFLLGFSSSMNYKNIDFSFNLRASIGNRMYNNVNSNRAVYNRLLSGASLANVPVSVLDSNFENTLSTLSSDYYIENASFLRMDNINLGYTFPKWLEGKASLRLFTGVQNVFVVTKYSGLDPEVSGGIDKAIYPRQRSLLFGANIKF